MKSLRQRRADEDGSRAIDRLARRMRGSLASLRAASEALERFPGMEAEQRRRMHAVVCEEADRLAGLIDALEKRATGANRQGREPVSAAELLTQVASAIAQPGLQVAEADAGAVGGEELTIDLEIVSTAFRALAAALRKDFAVTRCHLGAAEADGHLLIDWAWHADPTDSSRLQDWQGQALEIARNGPALRPTARRHGGEAWFALDRDSGPEGPQAHVRLLLPLGIGSA